MPSAVQQTALVESAGSTPYIDPTQTLRAATALVQAIKSEQAKAITTSAKQDLLADADDEDGATDDQPIWLVLSTKKHIVDKKRLKPGKIALPHPLNDSPTQTGRICLITTDPQRKYKDLIADPNFPVATSSMIGRVIGLKKLKAKYSSFESRRQLYGEYDTFLADDRIITYLPTVLGKVFYKTGAKRPIPVSLEGKRQSVDEQGNKRRKLADGGSKVTKTEVSPQDAAREIESTLRSALVHLAPSTSTSVKVGDASMDPKHVRANVEAVTIALVEKFVPQKWSNVRSVHIKGPNTPALPIYVASTLWQDEADVLNEAPVDLGAKARKSRRPSFPLSEEMVDVIEVPGVDGQMRRLERPASKPPGGNGSERISKAGRKRGTESRETLHAANEERAQKVARKEALQKQKNAAKTAAKGAVEPVKVVDSQTGVERAKPRTRAKAVDLI